MSENYDAQEKHIRDIMLGEKATSPNNYFNTSIGYLGGYDGVKNQPFNQEAGIRKFRSWVYACANVNAKRASSVGIKLYAKRKNNKSFVFPTKKISLQRQKYLTGELEEKPSATVLSKSNSFLSDFEEILEHPILSLLKKVNPFQNGYDFAYQRFLYLELVGNSYYHIITNNGIPQQLWTLPAQWVTIKPSKTQFIDYYLYGQYSTKQLKLNIDEVIHLKYPNPQDLYYGLGKAEASWSIINVNESEHNFRQYLYNNMARPDYAIIMKGLDNNQVGLQRYSKYLEGMLKGYSNSGKFITLPNDVELKPLTFAPKDLGQNDDAIITEICAVFGTPISKIKMNDANYSNSKEGNISWLRDSIQPMLRIDEETLNQELLTMYGIDEDAFLAYDNPIPADEELELKKVTQLTTYGLVTVNEGRASLGLPPIDSEDGDNLFYQGIRLTGGDNTPNEPEEPKEPKEEVAVDAEPAKDTEAHETKEIHIHNNIYNAMDEEVLEEMVEKAVQEKDEPEPKHIPTKLESFFYKYLDENENTKALEEENLIKNVDDVFDEYFSKQKLSVIDYLEKNPVKKFSEKGLEEVVLSLNEELVKKLQSPITAVLEAGAIEGLKEIGFSEDVFNVQNPKVQEALEKRNIKLAGNVSKVTLDNLKSEIRTAIDEGVSNQELAKRISKSSSFSPNRSIKIARTEVADIYEKGSHDAWEETGEVVGSEWVLSAGACEICKSIKAETGVVPLGEPYVKKGSTVAGRKLDYKDIKRPSAHVRCRCTTRAVLREE